MKTRTVTCPECGQEVPLVRLGGLGGVRLVLAAHSPPDWPGTMCPGAATKPAPKGPRP